MLAKKNRYTFDEKLPKNTLNSQSFSVKFDKNEEGLKVGIVVSKRVDKRAVVRNRIRRVIVEAVRKNLPADTNLTLIFYARSAASQNKDLASEVSSIITKL